MRLLLNFLCLVSIAASCVPAAQSKAVLGLEQAYLGPADPYNFVYNRDPDATWTVEPSGGFILRLFSDVRFKSSCAADVIKVVSTETKQHEISFEYKKDPTGLLVGVADPILRIQTVLNNEPSYETVETSRMTIVNLPNNWKRAIFTTSDTRPITQIAIVAHGGRVSLIYSARFDLRNVKVDDAKPSSTDLAIVFYTNFQPLLYF